ncbi:uncharacterized protein [Halyomorpha halys]|uniref:uncharacterized protein isoform X2 n=1 Tax=Halyomorpha halys TaxID=286706 RepID=UPI000D0C85E8|nr:uncharacterized protein LOC106681971 [Halyomorpha halys]
MEFRSIIWTTLTILWSVHSLKLESLGHYIEGLYLAHDVQHPTAVIGPRHVREVARTRHHQDYDMLFPFKYCCGGENNTVNNRKTVQSTRNVSMIVNRCFEERFEENDEWTTFGNPTKDPFSCENFKKAKDSFNCFFNCLMRGNGVLRDDGTEDLQVWEQITRETLAFLWLKDLAVTAFHKCVANKDYSWLQNGDKLECSPRLIDVNHCVWSQIILTCPEEHFVKNPYCKRVKVAFEDIDG